MRRYGWLANRYCPIRCSRLCPRWWISAARWRLPRPADAGSVSPGVERQDARQRSLDVLDAILRRRMRAEEFRLPAAPRRRHLVPQRDRRPWIVAGARHELEPDGVGFGFLLAAERKLESHLRDH